MNQELRVRFGVARHGWLALEIVVPGDHLDLVVSDVPNDFLAELAGALIVFLGGATRAETLMNQEPEEVELIFSSEGGRETLTIRRHRDHRRRRECGETLLAVCNSRRELVRPFWKALRELQGRADAEEFASHWRNPFPDRQVRRLGEIL